MDKKDKAVPRRRSEIPFGRCSFGQELCPVATSAGYECVNTISDMESCKSLRNHPPRHRLTIRWRMRTRVQRYRQTRTRLYRHPKRRRGHVQPRSMSSPIMRSRLPHSEQRYNLRIGKQAQKSIKTVVPFANSGFIAIGRRLALNPIIHWYG